MRRSTGAVAAFTLLLTVLGPGTVYSQDGWMTLFDGSDLDQWVTLGAAEWTVEGDVVEGSGESGFLVSADSYDDFHLTLEFWTDADANSGIFIRCSDADDVGRH